LSEGIQKVGQEMYGAAGGAAPGGSQAPDGDGDQGPTDEDVVEGEFSEAN
jgi:hypothetical protein